MTSNNKLLRVLVTGATGFLGGHVLRALQARTDVEIIAACRSPEKLPPGFTGDVRSGDLTEAAYREELVKNVDVICHCGTWGAFWGHLEEERRLFFDPARDLIERAIDAGVSKFMLASTVAIGKLGSNGSPVDDFTVGARSGFWPHNDFLIELDQFMRDNAGSGTQMITMRLGHFVGQGNQLGLVPALVPRLKTRLVPWIYGGKNRLALVSGEDMGEAFALASTATNLSAYEGFNICGPELPTSRDVFSLIAKTAETPLPFYSVPLWAAFAFGWLMEMLYPVLPGKAPFLTRSLVHVSKDWNCSTEHARQKLGFVARSDWRASVRASIAEQRGTGFAWPRLAQVAK